MNKSQDIVTVDISMNAAPFRTKYAILCDRTPKHVLAFSAAHPDWFVFCFYTKEPERVPAFRYIQSHRITRPLYVGNCDHISKAISSVVQNGLSIFVDTSDCVYDETPKELTCAKTI